MLQRRNVPVLILVTLSVVLLLVVAYFAVGYLVYTRLANVRGSCDMHLDNRPDHFTDITGWAVADLSPFFVPDYETVRFPARQADLQISGWYVAGEPDAPAIIVVDGLGGCKYAQATLVPAGILARDGFSVLMIDLRNTGDSDLDDGFSGIGNKEYQDVLGAWDWLITEKGFDAAQIGILGNSLGAAAVMFAFQHEPRIATIALNSPFANLPQIIREEMQNNHIPTFLAPVSILMGKLFGGQDLLAHDPVAAILSAGERPVWILHSTGDTRIGVHHSYQLQRAAEAAAIDATFWFVDDIEHIRVPGLMPDEFRARLGSFFRSHLGAQ